VDARGEGFNLTGSASRSAIGYGDGQVFLVATSGTFEQLAQIMKGLGCSEAIGLDGGASSALWAGSSARSEGRTLASAVVLIPR
jgi:hypothetical protein